MASTKYDTGKPDSADLIERQSSKPDFQILIYPGIRPQSVTVTKDTPPTFLLCADNDKEGVPAELHIYASGGHGFGLRTNDPRHNVIYATWALRLQDWMADVGMSPARQPKTTAR